MARGSTDTRCSVVVVLPAAVTPAVMPAAPMAGSVLVVAPAPVPVMLAAGVGAAAVVSVGVAATGSMVVVLVEGTTGSWLG